MRHAFAFALGVVTVSGGVAAADIGFAVTAGDVGIINGQAFGHYVAGDNAIPDSYTPVPERVAYLDPAAMSEAPAVDVVYHPHWYAHSGSWVELDFLSGRDTEVGHTFDVNLVRFGPRVGVGRHLYVGAEIDIGNLSNPDSLAPAGVPYASTSGGSSGGASTTPSGISTDHGTLALGKLVVGAHAMLGPLSGGAELAGGVRDVTTFDKVGEVAGGDFGSVFEAHGRVDLWLMPKLTIGALAGVSLEDSKDFNLGLSVGWHFIRYDGLR